MEQYIKDNSITYIIQTDVKGAIIDANQAFHNAFNHIQPQTVIDIVPKDDLRRITLYSERVKRQSELSGEIERIAFECRTIAKDNRNIWGLYEVAYVRKYYYILGYDAYLAYEDGRGRIRRYEKVLRAVAHALNHNIRSKSANISGLLQVLDIKDRDMADKILEQAKEMDNHIINLSTMIYKSKG